MLILWWILQGSLTLEGVQGEQSFRKFRTAKTSAGNELVFETPISNIIHIISQTNSNPWTTYTSFT